MSNMKAVAILRCSTKPQLDRYGPSNQLADVNASLPDFPLGTVELIDITTLQESASKWTRQRWESAMDNYLAWYKQGKADVLIFPRVDRETRFIAGSFPKLLEVIKSGMLVYFARERLLLDPKKPNTFEDYQRKALDAQAYIRVLRENTMPAKQEAAKSGNIPAGYGRYGGYIGLRYDRQTKRFEHIADQIAVVHEILRRYLGDESASEIARSLQARGIGGPGGNVVHRSNISRVLGHSRVYAGQLVWNGIVINGKIDPIITLEEADAVAERLKRNKERSLGYGRRKWLTGRVFCGVCGARYNLNATKGCLCNRADSRNPSKCESPKVKLRELYAIT